MKRFVKKTILAMFATVFFLFAYNHVNTEMAKDNFMPMFWLFVVLIVLIIYRFIRRIFRTSKR
ncbi:hypothetical protein [Niallia sp. MER 6]|uniref:hypothetical protein n=1 Tax=Niallia sp. MER 6 TaxID=2939567 RepID=UPI00203DFB5C|nr:hypothetical protein [Niallia sp. MER 6]MCM3032592.1 hypothetical protein [Niallia sp. MER 6]